MEWLFTQWGKDGFPKENLRADKRGNGRMMLERQPVDAYYSPGTSWINTKSLYALEDLPT